MSFRDYRRLTGQDKQDKQDNRRTNIADALAMPVFSDIAFEPPRATIDFRPADFS